MLCNSSFSTKSASLLIPQHFIKNRTYCLLWLSIINQVKIFWQILKPSLADPHQLIEGKFAKENYLVLVLKLQTTVTTVVSAFKKVREQLLVSLFTIGSSQDLKIHHTATYCQFLVAECNVRNRYSFRLKEIIKSLPRGSRNCNQTPRGSSRTRNSTLAIRPNSTICFLCCTTSSESGSYAIALYYRFPIIARKPLQNSLGYLSWLIYCSQKSH